MSIRWTPRLKSMMVKFARDLPLCRSRMLVIFEISEEELLGWERDYKMEGERALRVTKIHNYHPHRRQIRTDI